MFAIVGDGEINEGAIWEAAACSPPISSLSNLTVIVDANGFQAMGSTDEVLRLGNIADKFAAFGFETRTVDGHDEAGHRPGGIGTGSTAGIRPRLLVANTVKGHGRLVHGQ